MSSVKCGIVGLPNAGKSTLFNALRQAQGKLVSNPAFVANYPFATIEPNVEVMPVPDQRLEQLAEVVATSTPEESKPTAGTENNFLRKLHPEF